MIFSVNNAQNVTNSYKFMRKNRVKRCKTMQAVEASTTEWKRTTEIVLMHG